MKHSIRYIQVNYTGRGAGFSITVIRGMELRDYKYSTRRFDAILEGIKGKIFEMQSFDTTITFTRVYPE